MSTGSGAPRRPLLRPIPLSPGDAAEPNHPLVGGPLRFREVELLWDDRRERPDIRPLDAALDEVRGKHGSPAAETIRERLTSAPVPPHCLFAGDEALIMGVVNVTPDSFSDGGLHADTSSAVARARRVIEAGADLVDIGGESARPGAEALAVESEAARVIPVIEALRGVSAPLSIDTRNAPVMDQALAAGAAVVNDVSGLRHDPDAAGVVARAEAPVVLMHSRGTPSTMRDHATYDDVVGETYDELAACIEAAVAGGVARERIVVDPGFGFAKTAAHNLALLARLSVLHGLGRPIAVGLSRKSFIARVSRDEPADRRLAGSLAGALWALGQGVRVLRVHDVAETRQALAVWRAIQGPRARV